MKLPIYPETVPSGFQGLGALPKEWEVVRGRFVMQINPPAPRLRMLRPEDEVSFVPMEAVGEDGRLNLDQTRALADVSSGYTEFQDGDVVVAKITPCFENGKAALARGLVNGAAYGTTELHVLRAGPTLERGFLFYVAISDRFRKLGESEMYGAGGQKRVPPEFNKDFPTPIPPLHEQQQITAFLDWKMGQLDGLIARKQELLEKLKEKRLALITQAVTRGLNPAVPLRDSGIAWLGPVPQHWKVKRIKFIGSVGNGSTPSRDNALYWADGDYPWLNSSVVNQESVTMADQFVTADALAECHLPKVQPPAVLIGITGEGRTRGMATTLLLEATINQHLAYVKPDPSQAVVGFLRRVFDMAYSYLRSESDGGGSTKGAITCEQIEDISVPVPPTDEQERIAAHIDTATQRVDRMREKIQTAIARLTEYRTALITAATTGKIDVRNLKTHKPVA